MLNKVIYVNILVPDYGP